MYFNMCNALISKFEPVYHLIILQTYAYTFASESHFRYSSVKPPMSKCREKAVKGENGKCFNSKLDFLRKDTSRNAWVF